MEGGSTEGMARLSVYCSRVWMRNGFGIEIKLDVETEIMTGLTFQVKIEARVETRN